MNHVGSRHPEVSGRIVVAQEARRPDTVLRVLVTNDDGIDSPGIAHLAHALAEQQFDVTVAAPSRDWSGSGTGIGHLEPDTGVPMRPAGLGLEHAYAIDGPPGLAVMAAALGAFGEPFDVVVSGVNAGVNTGQSVIHSGTVGAALTARTFGSHGVAISTEPADAWCWNAAAEVAVAATRWVARTQHEPTALSINTPARPLGEIRGLRAAELDRFGYFRVAIAGDDKIEFEVMSDGDELGPGCDTALLRDGFATITKLGTLVGAGSALPDDLSEIWPGP